VPPHTGHVEIPGIGHVMEGPAPYTRWTDDVLRSTGKRPRRSEALLMDGVLAARPYVSPTKQITSMCGKRSRSRFEEGVDGHPFGDAVRSKVQAPGEGWRGLVLHSLFTSPWRSSLPAGGAQRLASEDGSCVVVVNGEIHKQLVPRRELGRRDEFSTRFDPELNLYRQSHRKPGRMAISAPRPPASPEPPLPRRDPRVRPVTGILQLSERSSLRSPGSTRRRCSSGRGRHRAALLVLGLHPT
jgi:hypothetical protein